jgi:glyoxylase-like metal-dependent hydrolase (beta-lactamase superfamily II)
MKAKAMLLAEGITRVPDMSADERVRIYRRSFQMEGEFGGMEVDSYVVVTQRFVAVLDTLLCPEDMQVVMQDVQSMLPGRQLLVINSHADWDHCWGNGYFSGTRAVPVIAQDYGLTRQYSEEALTELHAYQQHYPLFKNVVLIAPTITFAQRLTLHGGDLSIELFAAPGHQRDHIAAWMPELRLLLAFDAVEMPVPMLENAESVPLMQQTLERFLALHPQRVLCSHGKTTDIEQVERNLEYLHEIERRCQRFLTAYHPSAAELEQPATLIGYSFEEVIAQVAEPVDHAFYSWVHDNNVRCVLQWLMNRS